MSKTVLNVKTDTDVKREAQKLAKDMGVPLSVIVNANLKQFINERRFAVHAPLVPTPTLAKVLDEAQKEWNEGNKKNSSPVFNDMEDAIKWLNRKR